MEFSRIEFLIEQLHKEPDFYINARVSDCVFAIKTAAEDQNYNSFLKLVTTMANVAKNLYEVDDAGASILACRDLSIWAYLADNGKCTKEVPGHPHNIYFAKEDAARDYRFDTCGPAMKIVSAMAMSQFGMNMVELFDYADA